MGANSTPASKMFAIKSRPAMHAARRLAIITALTFVCLPSSGRAQGIDFATIDVQTVQVADGYTCSWQARRKAISPCRVPLANFLARLRRAAPLIGAPAPLRESLRE